MNLQKILPYDKYTIATMLSAGDIIAKIANLAAPLPGQSYQGFFNENSFQIRRIIRYRNSFLPVIKGSIAASPGSTDILITMRPPVFALVFMSVWLGIIGSACLGVLYMFLQHKYRFAPQLLFPFAMFIFGYGMLMIAYKLESKKSKTFLAALFEGLWLHQLNVFLKISTILRIIRPLHLAL